MYLGSAARSESPIGPAARKTSGGLCTSKLDRVPAGVLGPRATDLAAISAAQSPYVYRAPLQLLHIEVQLVSKRVERQPGWDRHAVGNACYAARLLVDAVEGYVAVGPIEAFLISPAGVPHVELEDSARFEEFDAGIGRWAHVLALEDDGRDGEEEDPLPDLGGEEWEKRKVLRCG